MVEEIWGQYASMPEFVPDSLCILLQSVMVNTEHEVFCRPREARRFCYQRTDPGHKTVCLRVGHRDEGTGQ